VACGNATEYRAVTSTALKMSKPKTSVAEKADIDTNMWYSVASEHQEVTNMKSIRRQMWGMLVFLVAASAISAAPAADQKPSQDYWMGVYLKSTKIGYAHITVRRDRYKDKDAWRREETLSVRFQSNGKRMQIGLFRNSLADERFSPISESVRFASRELPKPTEEALMNFNYDPDQRVLEMTGGAEMPTITMPYDAGEQAEARAGMQYDLGALALGDGSMTSMLHMSIRQFSVSAVSGKEFTCTTMPVSCTVTVEAREKVNVGGKSYDTVRVLEASRAGKVRRWHLKTGEILKEELLSGRLSLIQETKAKATDIDKGDGPNLSKLVD
jgi:hypothetical protein